MSENTICNYSDTCSKLDSVIQDLDVRIRVSEQNKKLLESYTVEQDRLNANVKICMDILAVTKPMLLDIQEYINTKRKVSMQNINNALRVAGEIIKDSTEGICFSLDKDEAWLSTPDGLEVDMVEGGGYRQISSTLIRSVILEANQDTLNTMLLDEIFSLVSPENSSVLSMYLNVICNSMQIISIEQKPQVYSNIDSITYTFSKDNEFAEVTKKFIKHDNEDKGVSNAS